MRQNGARCQTRRARQRACRAHGSAVQSVQEIVLGFARHFARTFLRERPSRMVICFRPGDFARITLCNMSEPTMTTDKYQPRPEHKFSFGLWTVGNPGRDPFGEPVRPILP